MDRPERYARTVIPHVMVVGAADAIAFYERALGASELFRIAAPDGRVLHAELDVQGSLVMVGDADPPFEAPGVHATSTGLHVYVQDVDSSAVRVEAAGAAILQPPQSMFYGDRSAVLRDPFGHVWVLLEHVEDVDVEIIRTRGEALLRAGGQAPLDQSAQRR